MRTDYRKVLWPVVTGALAVAITVLGFVMQLMVTNLQAEMKKAQEDNAALALKVAVLETDRSYIEKQIGEVKQLVKDMSIKQDEFQKDFNNFQRWMRRNGGGR